MLLILLLAGPAAGSAAVLAQLRTDVEERTRARVLFQRVRFERTHSAKPGECNKLGPERLTVSIRPEKPAPGSPPRSRRTIKTIKDPSLIKIDRSPEPTVHALVLDTSASMGERLAQAREAAVRYVRQLEPERESALLVTFDENVILRHGVTANRDSLAQAVEGVRLGGHTALFDALTLTMRELDAYAERPVLVLLSDGDDTVSFFDGNDVLAQSSLRPDLTIFTIGIGLRNSTEATRMLLRRLAEDSNGRFFDLGDSSQLDEVFARIRDILGTEVTVTLVDPEPDAVPGALEVRSWDPDCKVTPLADTPLRVAGPAEGQGSGPAPASFEWPATDAYAKLIRGAAELELADRCRAGEQGGSPTSAWRLRHEADSVTGCGPDILFEHGPLYVPEHAERVVDNRDVLVRVRPFVMRVPPLAELPENPEQALSALLEAASRDGAGSIRPIVEHDAHPALLHGTSLLELRPALARALYRFPEYRERTLVRLQRAAERELDALAQRYRLQFPKAAPETVAEVARHSLEGEQILARAAAPSEIDLQRWLGAWLGDIAAHDLFVRWERSGIDGLLGAATPFDAGGLGEAWQPLRQAFFAPVHSRTLGILVPVADRDCDCIGFWRVTLPRPSLIRPRMRSSRERQVRPELALDLVPDRPLAWDLVRRVLAESPELAARLRRERYRVTDLSYELMGEPAGHDPEHAYARTRVALALASQAAPGGSGETRRLSLTAEVTLPGLLAEPEAGAAPAGAFVAVVDPRRPPESAPRIERLRFQSDDEELRVLARRARRALLQEADDDEGGASEIESGAAVSGPAGQ